MEAIDKERKEEFKKYEMEKEYLRKEKLKNLDETARKAEEEKYEELKAKHKKHPKLHHPVRPEHWHESMIMFLLWWLHLFLSLGRHVMRLSHNTVFPVFYD